MNINQVTKVLASIENWELSYIQDSKQQKVSGHCEKYECEIISQGDVESVSFCFNDVLIEILNAVDLFLPEETSAKEIFHEATISILSSSDSSYTRDFGDALVIMKNIDTDTKMENFLSISVRRN